MDFVALGLVIFTVAVVVALLSGDVGRWARDEWRLMRADAFTPTHHGITGGSLVEPGEYATREELKAYDRAKAMDTKMRAYAKRMRRDGRHLISGKQYIPVLTKPADPPPPKAGKVVPIFKPTNISALAKPKE